MAQPLSALPAVPGGEDSSIMDVTVKSTRSPWTSWFIVGVQSDGEVTKGKRVDDISTTSTFTTTILADELLCEL